MLVEISSIASEHSNPTNTTMKNVKKFVKYAASHQDTIVTYYASGMILACHSDTSYLR